MIRKVKYTISSTHIDKQGWMMTKEALAGALPQINGKRKMRIGLEHIRTFPPFGIVTNAELEQRKDTHYYLNAEMWYFDKQDIINLEDGTTLIKESFSVGEYPFIECKEENINTLTIGTDPANYDSPEEIEEINSSASDESGLKIDSHLVGRKSELSDPETIIYITTNFALALGIIKTKIPEKIGEALGDDLVKLYKFLTKLAIETIKRAKPANRPKNFVILHPSSDCIIELIITTNKPDTVLSSLTREKLKVISDKSELLRNLNPEKIQFIYNDQQYWEFNYLLTKTGEAIGTIKSFNKRNELYNQILEQQEKEKLGSS